MITQPKRYASVLAKIGAERSKLLSEGKQKALAETKDLTSLSGQLKDTSYLPQIAKVQQPITSRKLERAFNENFIESIEKIIKNCPKRVTSYLNLYALRFEIENIKVLIKSANAELGFEQKLARMYLSVEDYLKNRSIFEDAAKAQTVKQVVNAFKNTSYASTLNSGLQGYEEKGSTARFDVLLDKGFYDKLQDAYQHLPKAEKPHAIFYASMENDIFSLLTLLRGKSLNHDANWLRLATPRINFYVSTETVESLLSAPDFESALKIALESHYGKFFIKSAIPVEAIGNTEQIFMKTRFEHAKSKRIFENFNIGAPLAYLTQKEAEVHNLVAISSGVEASVSPELISSQLQF